MNLLKVINASGSTKIILRSVILVVVVFISYFTGSGISSVLKLSDIYVSGTWCAISAVVVFDDQPLNAKKLMVDRLLGTFFGALLTTLILFLSGRVFLSISISLFVVCASSIVFKLDGAMKIGCITVLIIGITAQVKTFDSLWQFGLMRCLESFAGCVISLLATLVIDKTKRSLGVQTEQSKLKP